MREDVGHAIGLSARKVQVASFLFISRALRLTSFPVQIWFQVLSANSSSGSRPSLTPAVPFRINARRPSVLPNHSKPRHQLRHLPSTDPTRMPKQPAPPRARRQQQQPGSPSIQVLEVPLPASCSRPPGVSSVAHANRPRRPYCRRCLRTPKLRLRTVTAALVLRLASASPASLPVQARTAPRAARSPGARLG
jgi:hypothetical protein